MTDIKRGDRVRVTIEGEVTWASPKDPRRFEIGDHYFDGSRETPSITPPIVVEKIEPPVEVFKPGDVVRKKDGTGSLITLALTGFINGGSGLFHEYGAYGPTNTPDGCYKRKGGFTSKDYEKVSLG